MSVATATSEAAVDEPAAPPSYATVAFGTCPSCLVEVKVTGGRSALRCPVPLGSLFPLRCMCGTAFDGRVVAHLLEPWEATFPVAVEL